MRTTLKEVERILHPCPNIDGFDILHEHQKGTGNVIFTAWKGQDVANKIRSFAVPKQDILDFGKAFYEHVVFLDSVNWLLEGIK